MTGSVTKTDSGIDLSKEIGSSVDALLKMQKKFMEKKNIFEFDAGVFLQIVMFKIPKVKGLVKRRVKLKHPIVPEGSEVCLIVPDFIVRSKIKRTSDEMIETSIENYQELLKKHNITGITHILPFKQLKTEYNTYCAKKKLVDRFDIFLCGTQLFERYNFVDHLGKIFIKKRKYPISVRLPQFKSKVHPVFNERIQNAICSSIYYLKTSSDNVCIRIGSMKHSKEQLIENVEFIINKIYKEDYLIPGGFNNVRQILLKCEKSKAIPIYMSMASGNNVPVPVVSPNAKLPDVVEGELTTIPGKQVTVYPSGKIIVTNKRENDSEMSVDEENYEEDEDEDEDESGEVEEKTSKKASKAKRGRKKEDESEDDNEDHIESAEQKYLLNLQNATEDSEEEKEEQKPIVRKGVKRSKTTGIGIKKAKRPKIAVAKKLKINKKSKNKVK